MADFHRIPRKQLDEDLVYTDTDLSEFDGISFSTAELEEHIVNGAYPTHHHEASRITYDSSGSPLLTDLVQDALDEIANYPLAVPAQEDTGLGPVGSDVYQFQTVQPVYVGVTGGEDPNGFIGLFDTDGNEIESITVTDVTSDLAGTTSVIGDMFATQPYIQFSGNIPEELTLKFGIESSLLSLPKNALLREGILVGEVDGDVQAFIAEIKGTNFDVPVAGDSDLVSLDSRIDALEAIDHEHAYSVEPDGTKDGVNRTFTIPSGGSYISGSLQVYIGGVRIKASGIQEDSAMQFTLTADVYDEQLPNSATNDWIEIDYEVL